MRKLCLFIAILFPVFCLSHESEKTKKSPILKEPNWISINNVYVTPPATVNGVAYWSSISPTILSSVTGTQNQWLKYNGSSSAPTFSTLNTDTSLYSSYEPIPIFNVASPKYGAVGDSVTDNTTAFQNAINDAFNYAYKNGKKYAEVYVPHNGKDYYLVNGAFIRTNSSSTPAIKSILYWPTDSTNQITIRFRGPQPSMLGTGLITGLNGNVTIFTKQRDATGTAWIISPKYYATGSPYSFSYLKPVYENLNFLTPWNSGVGCVDGGWNSQFSMINCTGGADTNLSVIEGLTTPTNKAQFVRTPFNNNDGSIYLSNIRVDGMYQSFTLNEQCHAYYLHARDCYIGINFNNAYHTVLVDGFTGVHCPYTLNFSNVSDGGGPAPTSFCTVSIKNLDIETISTGWVASKQEINDTNNAGYGSIYWHNVLGGSGVINTIHQFHGLNLSVSQMDNGTNNTSQISNAVLFNGITNNSSGASAEAQFRVINNSSDAIIMGITGSGHTGSGESHLRTGYINLNVLAAAYTGLHFHLVNSNSYWFEINTDTTLFGNSAGAWAIGTGSTNTQIASFGGGWLNIAKSTTGRPCLSMIMGVPPTTPPTKSISHYGFQNNDVIVDSSGAVGTANRTLFTSITSASDSNSNLETSIVGSAGIGSTTIPANFFSHAGRTLHIWLQGYHSAAAAPTLTIKVKLGSTVITSVAISESSSTQTGIIMDVSLTCRTTGATGLIMGGGEWSENNANSGLVSISPIAINTAASQVISVTATWSVAATTNVVVGQQCKITQQN